MTCIVAWIDKNKVAVAADRLLSNSHIGYSSQESKLFPVDVTDGTTMIFGVCGSPRVLQLLRYGFDIPAPMSDDFKEYLVIQFVPAFMQFLADNKSITIESNLAEMDSNILIAYQGRAYIIQSDFQVLEVADQYIAMGSGTDFALGACHALDKTCSDMDVTVKAKMAVEAAAKFCVSVGGKIDTQESITNTKGRIYSKKKN